MAAERQLERILIKDLVVRCIIGIRQQERENRQDVVINVVLHADLRQACESDRIDDTINYKTIKDRIVAMVEQSEYFLVERLAQRIAEICLEDARVRKVEVTVEKPGAMRFARSVGVCLVRER